jgi:RNA polymerase sigma-70 factor (ECF subfamily)
VALEETARELLSAGRSDEAATAVIRALGPGVLRYLRSLLPDEGDTTDAFSQWAENLWRGLPGFRGEASLRTWSLRLAYHAALAIHDGAWRRKVRRLESGEASRIAASIRTVTAVRVERQRRKLARLREELSADDRTLLALRLDQQLSWEEIAQVMAGAAGRIDPKTLAKRFERLKERLRDRVKELEDD